MTQPIIGFWPLTLLININYNCWILVMWMGWVTFAFTARKRPERTQFLLSFMLIWAIGGSLLAIIFSSAGPCYYEALGLSPNPYLPLMQYLGNANEIVPIWALNVQEMLWQGHLGNSVPLGISAMPGPCTTRSLCFLFLPREISAFPFGLSYLFMEFWFL